MSTSKTQQQTRSQGTASAIQPKEAPATYEHRGGSRSRDKMMIYAFKTLRALVAVVNVTPYVVVIKTLLPLTAIAAPYAFISSVPIFGHLTVSVGAFLLWYLLQRLETMKGRDAYWIRGIAYFADALLCFITFPPLVGGLQSLMMFALAAIATDIDLKNLGICVFAILAWELINAIEERVFPNEKMGFWGVKL